MKTQIPEDYFIFDNIFVSLQNNKVEYLEIFTEAQKNDNDGGNYDYDEDDKKL